MDKILMNGGRWLTIILVLALIGCATVSAPSTWQIQPTREAVDVPLLNTIQEAELGETILSKGILYTYPTMTLLNELRSKEEQGKRFSAFLVVPAGELVATMENASWVYYSSKRFEVHIGSRVSSINERGGIKISKINNDVQLWSAGDFAWNLYSWSVLPDKTPEYRLKKVRAVEQTSFQQELIYNGRVGNSVKFMYREVSNDLMRPAFSQEIQYDLNESKVVGFKGARIEIIEATNTKLKYKALQNFPDQT